MAASIAHEANALSTRVRGVSENKECLEASQPGFKVGGLLTGWREVHPVVELGSLMCLFCLL